MPQHAISYKLDFNNLNKKPHRSNEYKEKRKKKEESLKSDEIEIKHIIAPEWLCDEGKKEFIKTVKYLKSIDLATKLDVNSLGVYADSVVKYANFENEINKLNQLLVECNDIEDILEKIKAKERILKMIDKSTSNKLKIADNIRKYSVEFGLTAQSRAKLAIPREKENKKSEFDSEFGDI